VIQYRGYRSSFLKELFTGVTGVLLPLPKGSVAGAKFAGGAMNAVMGGIAIGYLRGLWNDYACEGKRIVAGPYYHGDGTYTQAPTTVAQNYSYVCKEETWNISWDNGGSWKQQAVKVCEFVYMQ
jgi:hypothetical protein